MKTPAIIAGAVLAGLAGLLFWDSTGQAPPAQMAPATPVSTNSRGAPRVTNVGIDLDLRRLKEPPAVEAVLIESPVTAQGLAELGRFSGLRSVELHHVPVNDASIDAIKKSRQINRLSLAATGIKSRHVVSLSGCENLVELGLQGETLDAAALAAIGRMKQLKSLSLDGSSIDDKSLDYLDGLENLAALSLAFTAVTSEGAAKLEKFSQIRELNLQGTPVGHAALVHFARMARLEVLHIEDTRIGPRYLEQIKELKQVRVLQVSNSFSLQAIIELRKALPKTLVYKAGNHI